MPELGPSPLTRGDELPVAAARAAIAAALQSLPRRPSEWVPLTQSDGRILAANGRDVFNRSSTRPAHRSCSWGVSRRATDFLPRRVRLGAYSAGPTV